MKKTELIKLLNERLKKKGLKARSQSTFYNCIAGIMKPSPEFAEDLEAVTEIPFHHFLNVNRAPENPWNKLLEEEK